MAGSGRGTFSGPLGFILAAAGSAVGLGNIWRFPYVTGENGGAAFVLIYLVVVVLLGIPLLMNEIAIGRATRRNPVDAILHLKGGWLVVAGILSVIACFMVLSYYSVIGGWTLYYAVSAVLGEYTEFGEFARDIWKTGIPFAIFLGITIWIVQGGVSRGIELASRILMPFLFFLVVGLAVYSLTLKGAWEGVKFYLQPDFSEVTGETFLHALGQAFFSLSVGWGLMITYGSYLPARESIPRSTVWVAIADTSVAILGGLIVFPAVFAMGLSPDSGPALTFQTLPQVFERMGTPAGQIIGGTFFALLTIAAVTSAISMLEVPVSLAVDRGWMARRPAAILIGSLAFLVGIPSLLSQGGHSFFTHFIPSEKILTASVEAKVTLHDLVRNETYVPEPDGFHRVHLKAHRKPMIELRDPASGKLLEKIPLREGDILLVWEGDHVSAGTPLVRRQESHSFLDVMDRMFGTLAIVLIALLLAIFTGWNRMRLQRILDEIAEGEPRFRGFARVFWVWIVRFVAPVSILFLLISGISG